MMADKKYMAGYNRLGRVIVDIYQHGPSTERSFTIHTPTAVYRGLTPAGVLELLQSFPYRPALQCQEGVCGGAKNRFRSAIAHMPLPEGLQQSPQV
jgi:hypothetical protein